jgi:hypothetical protein
VATPASDPELGRVLRREDEANPFADNALAGLGASRSTFQLFIGIAQLAGLL